MSHVTDVKMRVKDIDALEEACTAIGLELRRDQKSYAWWGSFVGDSNRYGEHTPEEMGKCAHAIRVKGTKPQNGAYGPWEIGVIAAKDGNGFKLFYDTYGGAGNALSEKVGADANSLRQAYSEAVSTKKVSKLRKLGFRVSREQLESGHVKLKLKR